MGHAACTASWIKTWSRSVSSSPARCSKVTSSCRPVCTVRRLSAVRARAAASGSTPRRSGRALGGRAARPAADRGALAGARRPDHRPRGRARARRARDLRRAAGRRAARCARGFSLGPSDRVVVIEDVVTTGGSTRETMDVATAAGATVVGAGAIIDRSGGHSALGVPFHALVTLSLPTYQPDAARCARRGRRSRSQDRSDARIGDLVKLDPGLRDRPRSIRGIVR